MTKIRLNYIIDIILTYLICFILFYAWINFYKKNITISFVLSFIISFCVVFLIFFIRSKVAKKKNVSLSQKEQAIMCASQLKFSTKANVINYFYKNLSKKEKTLKHKNFIETTTSIIYPFFEKQILDLDSFSQIYKSTHQFTKNVIILCDNAQKDCLLLCSKIKNKRITILNAEQTYIKFIKDFEKPPEEVIITKTQKLEFKELLSYISSKERTKNYILMGIILIISSFFVMFKVYYLVFGSILLSMALLTRILPYMKKK